MPVMSKHVDVPRPFFLGGETAAQCQSSTFLGILIPIIVLLLLVIFLLGLKMCCSQGVKKSQPSLWTEQEYPLNSK